MQDIALRLWCYLSNQIAICYYSQQQCEPKNITEPITDRTNDALHPLSAFQQWPRADVREEYKTKERMVWNLPKILSQPSLTSSSGTSKGGVFVFNNPEGFLFPGFIVSLFETLWTLSPGKQGWSAVLLKKRNGRTWKNSNSPENSKKT